MSKRYREVLEEVETPASRRDAARDVAAVADEAQDPSVPVFGGRTDEGGTGTMAAGSGSAGAVATLVRPPAPTGATPQPAPSPRPAARPGNGPADAAEPLAFTWRGRRYAVTRILGHWREEEGWWRRPDGEPIRIEQSDLWRVEAARGTEVVMASDGPRHDRSQDGRGVYELARRGRTWRLDRVWD